MHFKKWDLTHWGRVMHTCISNLTRLVAWLAPSHYLNQCRNIVNSNHANKFSEILSKIHTFSFKKMHLNSSSAKWRPFGLGLNVLTLPADGQMKSQTCWIQNMPPFKWREHPFTYIFWLDISFCHQQIRGYVRDGKRPSLKRYCWILISIKVCPSVLISFARIWPISSPQ